jgi:hypothetical protein
MKLSPKQMDEAATLSARKSWDAMRSDFSPQVLPAWVDLRPLQQRRLIAGARKLAEALFGVLSECIEKQEHDS